MELTPGGKSLAEENINRGIFQGDAVSPLLFVIAMMTLNHNLRKCTAGYTLSKSQEKIKNFMYMDDIKLFDKNEKELETTYLERIYSQDIGKEFGKEKCARPLREKVKQMTEGVELTNQVVIRTEERKPTNTLG